MNPASLQFFGPELNKGPFAAQRIEVAAVQIATALAQLRAPLTRSDDDLREHADFIRELADRLIPDWAAQLTMNVGVESSNAVQTSILAAPGVYSLLHCWLADTPGGGETSVSPTSVTWNSGVVLETVTAAKRFWIVTPATGVADVTVNYSGSHTWHWGIARLGRVYYSASVAFS